MLPEMISMSAHSNIINYYDLIKIIEFLTLSVAYTISANPRTVTAMPTAGPLTKTMSGFLQSMYEATYFLKRQNFVHYSLDLVNT